MAIYVYFIALLVFMSLVGFIVFQYAGGSQLKRLGKAVGSVLLVGVVGWSFWEFYLGNTVARRFGGTLTVELPTNAQFLGATWKEDSLWVTYYEPQAKRCVFKEFSRMGLVEGDVVIPNCNPELAQGAQKQ
jgi:hypothetical protein